ncbi:MAG: T9SS type A sorting domain-containing protein [Bacteroidetes bacterium]|nr:T9SS type A sorting domain-containing protein [Bacteroidota bacterium]
MKKLFIFGIFVLATIVVLAQNIARQMVVLEITTSVVCYYCPGAALGAEDLLNNGKFVAVIEHHNLAQGADPFKTTASQARSVNLGYGGGNPTAYFDVKSSFAGGNHTSSVYSYYLPKYNARINVPSPLSMAMDVTHSGLDYSARIKMIKVGTITSTNLRLMFVVTQSHIPYNWEGQTVLNYVNRLMLPDVNGTVVDFSASDTAYANINFSLNGTWPAEDCEIIAFVEDMTAKEALNGMKQGVVDLQPEFTASETSVIINQPVTFTNATTGGYIDTPETYEWLFPGANPGTSYDASPTVAYADSGHYDVTLIVNRGGQIDTITKTQFIAVNYPVGIQKNLNPVKTQVSPNPSHGVFTLDVYCGKPITVNVSVVDALNMTVYQADGLSLTNRLTKTIDLGHIAKGIYFVIVENEGNKTVKKVIVN